MSKADLCPVCEGSGEYIGEKCHGCQGKGWVNVPEFIIPRPKGKVKPGDNGTNWEEAK